MPRINIDDKLFGDDRFMELVSIIGDFQKSIGLCVQVFRLGQRFWAHDQLIPRSLFFKISGADLFLQVGLANRKVGGIYVCGSHEHFEWIRQKHESARKSVESRRNKSTSVQRSPTSVQPLAPALAPVKINSSENESITLSRGENARRANEVFKQLAEKIK